MLTEANHYRWKSRVSVSETSFCTIRTQIAKRYDPLMKRVKHTILKDLDAGGTRLTTMDVKIMFPLLTIHHHKHDTEN